jgi:hypothetical protein
LIWIKPVVRIDLAALSPNRPIGQTRHHDTVMSEITPEVHSQGKVMMGQCKIIEATKYILKTAGTDDVKQLDQMLQAPKGCFRAVSQELRHSMTATRVNAKKPVLKLRLALRSSEPQDPDRAPVSAPKPPPAMNPERAAQIAEREWAVKAAKAAEIAKTVEAHKAGKAELKRRATALLSVLCGRYPKAFDIEHPRPLKAGIDRDIAAEMDDTSLAFETDLRNAMRLYTSSPAYLTAMMAEGSQRIDLAGKTVEPVKQPHAGFAKFRLKRMGANR